VLTQFSILADDFRTLGKKGKRGDSEKRSQRKQGVKLEREKTEKKKNCSPSSHEEKGGGELH